MDIKVTDIQIGDWFRHRYTIDNREITRTFRVSRIEDELKKYYVWGDGFGRMCYPEKLEPIPITLDILKKNFVLNKEAQAHWSNVGEEKFFFIIEQEKVRWNFIWYSDSRKLMIEDDPTISIMYIHQLQHVLKLMCVEKEIDL